MPGLTTHLPLAALLTPAFLWAGAGLAAIPIVIHILNRRRFQVVQWAAMDYLLQAMRKNRRRLKFEQWLLLAVRCLVLLLLGLALARPMGCDQSSLATAAGRPHGLHVFVIDNSYSMGYEANRPEARTHLDQAKRLAQQLIDRSIASGQAIAVLTASASPGELGEGRLDERLIIPKPSYDREQAKSAIGRIEQTFLATDLPWALNQALEIARQSNEPAKELHLFTDGTQSAFAGQQAKVLEQLGPELARQFHITHYHLGRKDQWNQAVVDLEPTSHLVTTRFPAAIRANLGEFGTGAAPMLQWKLDEQLLQTTNPRFDTPDLALIHTIERLPSGGPHVLSASLISENRLKADDTRWRVMEVADELKVLIVEGDRGVGPLAGAAGFLELALAAPRDDANGTGRSDSYIQPELVSDLELGNRVLGDYRAVILANVAQVPQQEAEQLAAYARRGGTIVWFMGEQVNPDNYNRVLYPLKLVPGPLTKRMSVAADADGYTFNFQPHGPARPLLEAFAGQENSGLDTARVFTYWQIELPAESNAQRVLDYLPPGSGPVATRPGEALDPAITLHDLGEGHVIFVTTTANADWTSLPAKPAYVALMHEMLRGGLRPADQWMNLRVGQSLQLPPVLKLTAAPRLVDAAQKEIALEQTTGHDGQSAYRSPPLEKPGVYTLRTGSASLPIAVDVPAEEADIRILGNGAIKKALGNIDLDLQADQLPAETVAKASGNDYSWSVMLAVLAIVGLECFLAMRFGHYRRGRESVVGPQ